MLHNNSLTRSRKKGTLETAKSHFFRNGGMCDDDPNTASFEHFNPPVVAEQCTRAFVRWRNACGCVER